MIRCGKQLVQRVSAHQPIILLIFFRNGLEEDTTITRGFKVHVKTDLTCPTLNYMLKF